MPIVRPSSTKHETNNAPEGKTMTKIKRTVFDPWKVNNEMYVPSDMAGYFLARGWEVCV